MRRSRTLNPGEEPVFHCPRCGAEISPVVWGCGWDFDSTGAHPCEKCGYEGNLNSITEYENGFDGPVVQTVYEEEENASPPKLP